MSSSNSATTVSGSWSWVRLSHNAQRSSKRARLRQPWGRVVPARKYPLEKWGSKRGVQCAHSGGGGLGRRVENRRWRTPSREPPLLTSALVRVGPAGSVCRNRRGLVKPENRGRRTAALMTTPSHECDCAGPRACGAAGSARRDIDPQNAGLDRLLPGEALSRPVGECGLSDSVVVSAVGQIVEGDAFHILHHCVRRKTVDASGLGMDYIRNGD